MKKNQFRKFAIFTAFFLTSVLVGIFYYVNEQLRLEIESAGEVSNATITRVFINETWSEISSLLPEPGSNADKIKNNPNIKKIDNRMRRFMSYTDVLKVKLYNASGITVYSSEFSQIGEDKSKNAGLQRALKGNLASELTYRGKFGAFDGEIYNRNLVSTYAPIRDGATVIAVAELYSDRTTSIARGLELTNKLLFFLVITLITVYLIMLFVTYKIYAGIKFGDDAYANNSSDNGTARNLKLPQKNMENLITENSFPIPQLSLFGVGEIIQYIGVYGDLSPSDQAKIKRDVFLDELSRKGKLLLNRMNKYKKLIQDREPLEVSENVPVNINYLIKSISKYAASTEAIDSIKFYQGQKFSEDLIQPKGLIESILTSYIDLIIYGYSKSEIEVKFYGSEKHLGIDLIAGSNVVVNQSLLLVFQELDQLMAVCAKLHSIEYKATLTDQGLIISLSFNQSLRNSTQQSLTYLDAVVLGSSNTNTVLFDALLKKIGFSSVRFGVYAEIQHIVEPNQRYALVILYEQTNTRFVDLQLLLAQAKKLGLNSKDILIILAQESVKPVLDDAYQILTMPIIEEELRRHFINVT